ncbi:GNAT family N-acetyltransferase, partial [Pleomorphochaeta sp. DL1XJH-081]
MRPDTCILITARAGIAYISNVTVRERFRRKGIATALVAKAEAKAKSWG